MMKFILIFLFFYNLSFANNVYPELFSQLGTPLYQADKSFSNLPTKRQYAFHVKQFHIDQTKALELYKKGDNKAYLKALRGLSKEYKKIISLVKKEIINTIVNDKFDAFISLNNTGIDALYQQNSFKTQVYTYYQKNRHKNKSMYLEHKIQSEKEFQKQYTKNISHLNSISQPIISHHKVQNKIILLSTTWCGYCKKAKLFLKQNRIQFTEYDAETSQKGRSLMRKYHKSSYPTFIIKGEAHSGFNPSWIKERL